MVDSADMFHVDLVESSPPPSDMPAGKWCRYVISNRTSRVVGRYQGTLAQTRRNAEELASGFNERARSNRSVWTARPQGKKKSASKPAITGRG